MPRLSVAWVMLQRVPPDMRILTPGRRFFSRSSVRAPCSAARMAARRPAAPAPSTTTSQKRSSALAMPQHVLGPLGIDLTRLRIQLPGKPLDLFFVDPIRATGKSLASVQVLEVEQLLPADLIRLRNDQPLLLIAHVRS